MYPVSDAFVAELYSTSMQAVVTLTTSTGVTLSALSGHVDMDVQRAISRTCELELIPTSTLGVNDIYALVMTPGLEITVSRGLNLGAAVEMVPLGVFATDSASKPLLATGIVSWSGSDRSKRISRASFTDVYQCAKGASLATVATTLLQSRWAATPCDFSNVPDTLNTAYVFDIGADPWEKCHSMFADYGYDLYFDGLGTARAKIIPDPATVSPNFDFGVGNTNTVLGGETQGNFEGTYNGVVVTGEGSQIDPPVRGEAWDDNPLSPTYFQGGFGLVPMFQSSSAVTTVAAAQRMAATILAKVKGRKEQFSWPAVVNPALEPLDVVTVTNEGVTQRLVIDKLSIPLKASDPMTATGRVTSI